jgi:hypothetical protein
MKLGQSKSIVYTCATPTCTTEIAFHRDDYLPSEPWTCPACEGAEMDQQMESWRVKMERERSQSACGPKDGSEDWR